MEIGPVTGIRALPVMKSLPADERLNPVTDIVNYARVDDETYTPSSAKAASGFEDESSSQDNDGVVYEAFVDDEDSRDPNSRVAPVGDASGHAINLFA